MLHGQYTHVETNGNGVIPIFLHSKSPTFKHIALEREAALANAEEMKAAKARLGVMAPYLKDAIKALRMIEALDIYDDVIKYDTDFSLSKVIKRLEGVFNG